MNKSNFKQIFLTLALLITAATGAWAQEEPTVYTSAVAVSDLNEGDILAEGASITGVDSYELYYAANRWKNDGEIKTTDNPRLYPATVGANGAFGDHITPATEGGADGNAWVVTNITSQYINATFGTIYKVYIGGITYTAPAGTMTLSADGTKATMAMPASDVTVTYELVRDLAQQVTFGGIPTGDGLVVKNNGTAYEFVTAPTFTLTDGLADNADIISAEGITLTVGKMVEVEGFEGYRKFDETTAVSLADFLANPQPGIYKMKATANADGPYDGTIYSAEFTTVEKYDLAIQPADEYSKDKLSEVTVAGTAQTLDADGKATVPNVAPGAEVKLKAKTGYVIEKVEAKKPGPVAAPLDNTTTAWTAGTFAVPAGGLTYSDAITVSGDVTLVLTDGETLTLNKGISIASGATLTIQGNGTMNVNGTNSSTASTVGSSNGTLVLTSGTLTATGGNGQSLNTNQDFTTGASGGVAINGNVTIDGGTVTAIGGNGGNCTVTISGGADDIIAGNGGAAINGSVTVNAGTWTATNGSNGTANISSGSRNCRAGTGGAAVTGTVTDNRN